MERSQIEQLKFVSNSWLTGRLQSDALPVSCSSYYISSCPPSSPLSTSDLTSLASIELKELQW